MFGVSVGWCLELPRDQVGVGSCLELPRGRAALFGFRVQGSGSKDLQPLTLDRSMEIHP